ncbi:unnamed protein product, partial [Laminaria digitata]
RIGTRRRRTRSCGRSSYGTSCQHCSTRRTAGSRGDRGSRWWRAGTFIALLLADGVHQERGLEATGCRPRSFGAGEARTGVVCVSPRGRGQKWQHATFWQTPQIAGNEETWTTLVAKGPLRRPRRRVRGDGGRSAGERHPRLKMEMCSPVGARTTSTNAVEALFDVVSSCLAIF